ncbi:hypothetical protein [Sphingomonas sp. HMP6]|uniref:hypothetical protein n=1 Tax=Sphingomonas sp. HMP6 TaxID=1517551 RepID=UPI001596A8B2|nr:hypothetical protein [Sphingomonas sp. HMP6]BCA60050.1 hypothetical protein HMP06_2819 [Sphingomonas sp. HMP6]
MADLIETIEAMAPAQREGALIVLDALSRPLTAREIESILKASRVTRSRAVILASVLKGWHVLAMMGPEQ